MLRIYGQKQSRALRCLWVLEELQVPYEHRPLNQNTGETRTPEYLAINPSGKIPALDHDGFILTETVAINWYLADSFSGSGTVLLPRDKQSQARIQQWTSWALTEVEPHLVAIFKEGRRAAGEQDGARVQFWRAEIRKALATVLEPHLAQRPYLLGDAFSLADLNAAAILSPLALLGVDTAEYAALSAWLKRCLGRDAHQRALARN